MADKSRVPGSLALPHLKISNSYRFKFKLFYFINIFKGFLCYPFYNQFNIKFRRQNKKGTVRKK